MGGPETAAGEMTARQLAGAVLFGLFLAPGGVQAQMITVAPQGSNIPGVETDLKAVLARLDSTGEGGVIQLEAGVYELEPESWIDPDCLSCPDDSTSVPVTVGLRVSGRGVWILGPNEGEAVLRTNAGYGILVEDCRTCTLEGLVVTGGVRDSSAYAADAGIVVRNSALTITNCEIRDNIGDPQLVNQYVTGIMGIAGREGSSLVIRGNKVFRNSWDGIALFRGSQATIENNEVDGMDIATGVSVGGGRGVGVCFRGNAYARLRGNLIRHYWKGVGVFEDAQVTVEENVVEHMATWGMTLWDLGSGRPSGTFRKNVVYDTGACGISINRSSSEMPPPGQLVQNAFVHTGRDRQYDSGEPYCFQKAVADHAVPENFPISANTFYLNLEGRRKPGGQDVGRETFHIQMAPLWKELEKWDILKQSDFWEQWGPKPDSLSVLDNLLQPDSLEVPDSVQTAPADTAGLAEPDGP